MSAPWNLNTASFQVDTSRSSLQAYRFVKGNNTKKHGKKDGKT